MENISITKGELEDFKRKLKGLRLTIEILQDEEMIKEINGSEQNREEGVEVSEIRI